MTSCIRLAVVSSDHGANVRLAGGGLIASRRWPRPSPLGPWQIAQLAEKITPPASRASRDVNSPAGICGELRSHPEMVSSIANRATPAFTIGFVDHLIAKALHLARNGLDKLIETGVDGARSRHAQIDGFWNQPQQRHRGWVAIDEPRRIEEIGDPDLMRRQTVADGVHHIFSVDSDQGPRRTAGANGVDKDDAIRFRKQSQKGQAKRPSVFQAHARRDAIAALDASDCGGAEFIVAKQHIAESENEDADRLAGRLPCGIAAHRTPAFRLDKNL